MKKLLLLILCLNFCSGLFALYKGETPRDITPSKKLCTQYIDGTGEYSHIKVSLCIPTIIFLSKSDYKNFVQGEKNFATKWGMNPNLKSWAWDRAQAYKDQYSAEKLADLETNLYRAAVVRICALKHED